MTEPRKTPRCDAQPIPEIWDGEGIQQCPQLVDRDFARALEIETQELAEALEEMREAARGERVMNHRKYDALGIRVNDLLARHRVKQEASR